MRLAFYWPNLNVQCVILIMRLREFQNGKMGLNSSKIDRDTAKSVKLQILKNSSFCLKILNENCYISKFYVLHFLLYLGQFFSCINPFYHFGILKVSSLKWHRACLNWASNIVTILEKPSLIFYLSVSIILYSDLNVIFSHF